MASFTTRVELQDASPEEHEVLRKAMEGEGFARIISSNEGTKYLLPESEYNFSGNVQRSDVLVMAKRAVAIAGKPARILVTESAGRTWGNLKKPD